MNIKKLAEDLLNKSIELDSLNLSKEQAIDLEKLLKSMKKNIDMMPESSPVMETNDPSQSPLQMSTEVIKFDECGQWKIEKAAKPGTALDYSVMNKKPDYDKIEREANTINYSSLDAPKRIGAGSVERRNKIRNQMKEESNLASLADNKPAIETIKQRQTNKT
jgi:hypothetical protein